MFNKSSDHVNGNGSDLIEPNQSTPLLEIPEKVFIEKEVPEDKIKMQDPLDNNIRILFEFLDKSYQETGYNDALTNPDTNHMTENLEGLRNELYRIIRRVRTFYEDFMQEIDYHIDSRSRIGMIDTVAELTMKKTVAQNHLTKVIQIEVDANKNTGDSQGIFISYTKGFKNGLAAISHHSILKKCLN